MVVFFSSNSTARLYHADSLVSKKHTEYLVFKEWAFVHVGVVNY